VKLDGPLGLMKVSPGKKIQAEVNHGGVQGIELVLEAEFVLGGYGLTPMKELFEKSLVKGPGLLFVDPGQGGPADPKAAEVVELSGLSL